MLATANMLATVPDSLLDQRCQSAIDTEEEKLDRAALSGPATARGQRLKTEQVEIDADTRKLTIGAEGAIEIRIDS